MTLFSPSDVTAFHRIQYIRNSSEIMGQCNVTLGQH